MGSVAHPGPIQALPAVPALLLLPPNNLHPELKPGWGGGKLGTVPAAAQGHRPAVLSTGGCRVVVEVPARTFSRSSLLPLVPELLLPTFLSSPSARRTSRLQLSRRPRPAKPKRRPKSAFSTWTSLTPHPFTPAVAWADATTGPCLSLGLLLPILMLLASFCLFSPFPPLCSPLLRARPWVGYYCLCRSIPGTRVRSCHIWNPPTGCSQGTALPGGVQLC